MLISHILTIFDQMLNGKSISVVLPAYNAAETLEMTYKEIPMDIIDHIILVDDGSKDNTEKEIRGAQASQHSIV